MNTEESNNENLLDENMNNTFLSPRSSSEKLSKYPYQTDYREALRSLLWEPYDCRQNNNNSPLCLRNVPPPKAAQDSSSSSSCSSLNELLEKTVSWPVLRRKPVRSISVRSEGAGAGTMHQTVPHRWSGGSTVVPAPTPTPSPSSHCECSLGAGRFAAPYDRTMVVTNSNNTNSDCDCSEPPDPNANNVSVVNCYRAVPILVSNYNHSNVPTISCTNTDNVSNVNVEPRRPLRNRVVPNHARSVSNPVLGNPVRALGERSSSQQNLPIRLETHFGEGVEHTQAFLTGRISQEVQEAPKRTFTSTEAQTDDIGIETSRANREQRRRERRERRMQRRLHQNVLETPSVWQTNVDAVSEVRGLPDILNSHLPPPYGPPCSLPLPTAPIPLLDPLNPAAAGFPFGFSGSGRRSRNTGYLSEEDSPKSCCGVVVTQTISIRWFIVMIAFVGFSCVIVGTVLGAMKASGREHLTVSLLMIGVGIVLVTVSVVAWRLTSQDAPSCRSMLGFGSGDDSANEPNRRFVPRMPPSYGRPHHPYAAMMYPEFQYRPPPPSYQASMQEYRLRLLLLERPHATAAAAAGLGLQAAGASPPPIYRPHPPNLRIPNALCRTIAHSDYSHPPSYRSRTSSSRPTLDPTLASSVHSRDPSLISHVSDPNGNVTQSVVNVINVMGNTVELHPSDDNLKIGVTNDMPMRMMLKSAEGEKSVVDSKSAESLNLVTIVTVSDATPSATIREHSLDNDVLAHL